MENQPEFQPTSNFNLPPVQLPNSTTVLVLGIISIVGCFCYGIVGLICGIIALILAKKDLALFNANPSAYTPGSFSNLKSGRICAIIGLTLSILYFLLIVVLIITVGFAALSNPGAWMNQMGH